MAEFFERSGLTPPQLPTEQEPTNSAAFSGTDLGTPEPPQNPLSDAPVATPQTMLEGLTEHWEDERFGQIPEDERLTVTEGLADDFFRIDPSERVALAADLIPEEYVYSDFPFTLGEHSRYRSWDDLVEGVNEKDRFIGRLKAENHQARIDLEQTRSELQKKLEEAERRSRLLAGGLDESEVIRRQAHAQLDPQIKQLNVPIPKIEDYLISEEDFVRAFVADKGPDPTHFADPKDYREELKKVVDTARRQYPEVSKHRAAEYYADTKLATEAREAFFKYEQSAVDQIRQEHLIQQAQEMARQEAMFREAHSVQLRLGNAIDQFASGLDAESQQALAGYLDQPLLDGGSIREALVETAVTHGPQVEQILLAGLRAVVGAEDNVSVDVGSRRAYSGFNSIAGERFSSRAPAPPPTEDQIREQEYAEWADLMGQVPKISR